MRIITGLQPSGKLHVGNYFGAMEPAVRMQESGESFYFLADYHAMSTVHDANTLRENCSNLATDFLAVGLDPEKCVFFRQSAVPEVNELAWILSTVCPMGLLERCHSYKDKIAKGFSPSNALFTYPVLMAGDILLYQANLVPVGVDQTQHLEICRDIATRFNGLYGNVFTIPEGYYPKLGARVMSLQDPKRKMSKSDPDDCFISMLDGPDVVRRKLRRAVTDSESEIRFDAENKPGVSNLLAMLCALTGESMDHAVESFAGKGYGDLKSAVADAIVATLEPIQADYNRYMSDKAYLETVYRQGAERAGRMAERTLSKAMKKIGFIAK